MALFKIRGNINGWAEDGKKAAQTGRNGEALVMLFVVLRFLWSAMETIIENQFEIHAAIQGIKKQS